MTPTPTFNDAVDAFARGDYAGFARLFLLALDAARPERERDRPKAARRDAPDTEKGGQPRT